MISTDLELCKVFVVLCGVHGLTGQTRLQLSSLLGEILPPYPGLARVDLDGLMDEYMGGMGMAIS